MIRNENMTNSIPLGGCFLISTVKRPTLAAFLKKPRVNPAIHFQVQSVFACL